MYIIIEKKFSRRHGMTQWLVMIYCRIQCCTQSFFSMMVPISTVEQSGAEGAPAKVGDTVRTIFTTQSTQTGLKCTSHAGLWCFYKLPKKFGLKFWAPIFIQLYENISRCDTGSDFLHDYPKKMHGMIKIKKQVVLDKLSIFCNVTLQPYA